jgi:hypothetical protein
MIDEPTKHCNACGKDLPETEEYFFPSYLKETGRNICKTCHAERRAASSSVSFREKLREVAHFIQQDEVPSYQSLNSVATDIGWSITKVERDIYESKLPVFKFLYNNVGPALALKLEEAEAYIAAHRLNGQSQNTPLPQVETESPPADTPDECVSSATTEVEAEPLLAGTPDECASCGTTRGNILAVLDEKKEIRAYLCSTCYRTGSSYKWEPKRMRRMADLIERIGIQSFRE